MISDHGKIKISAARIRHHRHGAIRIFLTAQRVQNHQTNRDEECEDQDATEVEESILDQNDQIRISWKNKKQLEMKRPVWIPHWLMRMNTQNRLGRSKSNNPIPLILYTP